MTTNPNPGGIPQWTLGDRLRKARSLTGLSAEKFATQIGVSEGTITNAETDARKPRRITLLAYAMATGVPVEWLETGEVPQKPSPDGGLDAAPSRTGVWLAPLAAAA